MRSIRQVLWPLAILAALFSTQVQAGDDHFPAALLQMDDYFTHHILVAEKSTHELHLFKNNNGIPELVRTYQMATGKKSGDKIFQGDHRTPEGIYYFVDFLTHAQLIERHGKEGEIYGVGAFVMNYPNPLDQRDGKTGGGIWLHSTNDETRIEKGLDSRGCIVAANKHLIDIAQYIELEKTRIVVVHDLKYIKKKNWDQTRKDILDAVNGWKDAWISEDIDKYISYYHPKEFRDSIRGDINQFKAYKKAVFSNGGKPKINIDNLSILNSGDYAVATFKQDYASNTINDVGRKILYLKRDEFYNWKIVSEEWSKSGITTSGEGEKVAFRPSMRFFKSRDPSQILENNKDGNH